MINLIENEDVIVPFINGYYEPLYSIYSKACIPEFQKLLDRRWYKITDIFANVNIKKKSKEEVIRLDSSMLCFENINTDKQYLELKDMFD